MLNLFTIRLSSRLISLLAVVFSLLQFSIEGFSQCTGTATFTGSGNFSAGNPSSLATFTGDPNTACTIIIPSGITVTINSNTTWIGNVEIAGTLILTQQLNIGTSTGCGLQINLESGGIIKDDPVGGGANERLIICGKTILTTQPTPPSGAYNWPDPPGTGYTGPGSIGEDFNGALPITLVYFNGVSVDQQVILSWATSMEENFDYFDIERSTNGIEFQSIGSLQGVGGKDQLTRYSHIDYLERSGRYYYRLKSVDIDRSFEYSKIISVLVGEDDGQIIIYPNPISERKFKIKGLTSAAQLIFSDPLGKTIMETELQNTDDEIHIDNSIPSGLYLLRINGIGFSKVLKFEVP